MDADGSKKSALSRRLWIPLAIVALLAIPALRACGAEAPSSAVSAPAASGPAASAAVSAAPGPKAKPPERSVSRTGELCQEWKLGSAPRRVACPAILDDGELVVFERDATCTRRGGTRAQSPVPCPMAAELDGPLPPLTSARVPSLPDGLPTAPAGAGSGARP